MPFVFWSNDFSVFFFGGVREILLSLIRTSCFPESLFIVHDWKTVCKIKGKQNLFSFIFSFERSLKGTKPHSNLGAESGSPAAPSFFVLELTIQRLRLGWVELLWD